jgi:2-oxoglutarate ferredoxin oxidoreductase subunit gamma
MMKMDKDRIKIRIAGSGGQGVILASIILAEAAGIHDGRYVCQTQSYGPEARGGNCKAEVVISDSYIDYPKAKNLDILMCYNQASLEEYFMDLKEMGTLIVNSDHCAQIPISTAFEIPMTTLAREKAGSLQAMNSLSLGALAVATGVVSKKAIKAAVLSRSPKGTEALNLKALEIGFLEGKKAVGRAKNHAPEKFSRLILMND